MATPGHSNLPVRTPTPMPSALSCHDCGRCRACLRTMRNPSSKSYTPPPGSSRSARAPSSARDFLNTAFSEDDESDSEDHEHSSHIFPRHIYRVPASRHYSPAGSRSSSTQPLHAVHPTAQQPSPPLTSSEHRPSSRSMGSTADVLLRERSYSPMATGFASLGRSSRQQPQQQSRADSSASSSPALSPTDGSRSSARGASSRATPRASMELEARMFAGPA